MKSKFYKLQPYKISNGKLDIEVKRFSDWDNKHWVKVTFRNGTGWIVSLEELGRIVRAIGWCEDKKYPNGRGRFMLLDFLQDSLWNETSISDLLTKYQVKVRE